MTLPVHVQLAITAELQKVKVQSMSKAALLAIAATQLKPGHPHYLIIVMLAVHVQPVIMVSLQLANQKPILRVQIPVMTVTLQRVGRAHVLIIRV